MKKKVFITLLIAIIFTTILSPLKIVKASTDSGPGGDGSTGYAGSTSGSGSTGGTGSSGSTGGTGSTIKDIKEGADSFLEAGAEETQGTIDQASIKEVSDLVYNTFAIVGVCAAVIIGAILGIQFITGSVEQKVKVQESLVVYVIGCVVVFCAYVIWKLVIELLR